MRPLRTPNSCAPPFGWERSGLGDRSLLYTAQAMLGSSSLLFHLPPSTWPTARGSPDDSEHFRERQPWQR
ncbi:uncharacterized protein TrAtP1_000531 [Trichoderma atroviride]|uniref:uncharacterized protein n=1 Tax=Hypocrea atroviridis TaxID=63577 RepID=UPI00331D3CB2|nr:hypothetical protein TrAtP1_000531 [Trichoderma atroviride]